MLTRRLGIGPLVLPGAVWLALFFLAPLLFIAAVSVGTHDRFGRVLFDTLTLDNYRKAFSPSFIPTISRSVYYAGMTTILSIAIGYTVAFWNSRYRGRNKSLVP